MDNVNIKEKPLLEVQNLKMFFPLIKGLFAKKYADIKAVNGISFSIKKGETFGLVGESGCGKTTTGMCIVRVYKPTTGNIFYQGKDIANLSEEELRPYRRNIQLIFQDPYGSLDPRQTVFSIIKEAITADRRPRTKVEIKERFEELMTTVELDPKMGDRLPHEMSGGQRQRLGIARALVCSPNLIVCDEPVSALDVSIQAQIINLFEQLQEEFSLTYLFIAHDLAVVRHISNNIGVMYLGKLVEVTSANELYSHPLHPYTKALLSAVPIPDYYTEQKRLQIVLEGEVPSHINVPPGCPFHPRCRYATAVCKKIMPELKNVSDNRSVACHNV